MNKISRTIKYFQKTLLGNNISCKIPITFVLIVFVWDEKQMPWKNLSGLAHVFSKPENLNMANISKNIAG